LADALETLLTDHSLYARCCDNALQLSQTRYNYEVMAKGLLGVYRDKNNFIFSHNV
jgi:glycosyltransferase involved in cell wall biosynthesis